MKQEEFGNRLKKIENDVNRIFDMKSIEVLSLWYIPEEKTGKDDIGQRLENVKNNLKDESSSLYMELDGKRIYFTEPFSICQRVVKNFSTLAETQKRKFYNEIEKDNEEGEIYAIWSAANNAIIEAYDMGYSLLKKMGCEHFSKEEFIDKFEKSSGFELETLVAPYFRYIEREILWEYLDGNDMVIYSEEGRTRPFYGASDLRGEKLYSVGFDKNRGRYLKLLDRACEQNAKKEEYADYIFKQIVKMGKFVTDKLVEYKKIPEFECKKDVQIIYDYFLRGFLYGEISQRELWEALQLLIGCSLNNDRVQRGICNFLYIYDRRKWEYFNQWNKEHGYYIYNQIYGNVFQVVQMEDSDFIKEYQIIFAAAESSIEAGYYVNRYQKINLQADKIMQTTKKIMKKTVTIRHQSNTFNYENHLKEFDWKMEKIKETREKAANEYKKLADVKAGADNYIAANQWMSAIYLIDGKNAYAEWALFDIYKGLLNAQSAAVNKKGSMQLVKKVLNDSEQVFGYINNRIIDVLNNSSQKDDRLRTMALNVFRAACLCSFVKFRHAVWGVTDSQINEADLPVYKRQRNLYKMNQEEHDLKTMKQCQAIIFEGANYGIALSCALLADGWIAFRTDSNQKKQMNKVAAQRGYPAAMLAVGEDLLSEDMKFPEIMELYYWILLMDLLGMDGMEEIINKIEYTVYGGK